MLRKQKEVGLRASETFIVVGNLTMTREIYLKGFHYNNFVLVKQHKGFELCLMLIHTCFYASLSYSLPSYCFWIMHNSPEFI